MKKCFSAFAILAAGLLMAHTIVADEQVKSGPQVGENARPKPFFPLNLNGPTPDKKECLVCRNGNNPVAMVFARDTSPELVALISKLGSGWTQYQRRQAASAEAGVSLPLRCQHQLRARELAVREVTQR
jgi:hypothetical protein